MLIILPGPHSPSSLIAMMEGMRTLANISRTHCQVLCLIFSVTNIQNLSLCFSAVCVCVWVRKIFTCLCVCSSSSASSTTTSSLHNNNNNNGTIYITGCMVWWWFSELNQCTHSHTFVPCHFMPWWWKKRTTEHSEDRKKIGPLWFVRVEQKKRYYFRLFQIYLSFFSYLMWFRNIVTFYYTNCTELWKLYLVLNSLFESSLIFFLHIFLEVKTERNRSGF